MERKDRIIIATCDITGLMRENAELRRNIARLEGQLAARNREAEHYMIHQPTIKEVVYIERPERSSCCCYD